MVIRNCVLLAAWIIWERNMNKTAKVCFQSEHTHLKDYSLTLEKDGQYKSFEMCELLSAYIFYIRLSKIRHASFSQYANAKMITKAIAWRSEITFSLMCADKEAETLKQNEN